PVGQCQNFVELKGNEQHARALVAGANNSPMNELDRADIDAACRLGGDQQVRLAVKLARDDELLLVAAGKFSRRYRQVARAHIILLKRRQGRRVKFARGKEAGLVEVAVAVQTQQEILADRSFE